MWNGATVVLSPRAPVNLQGLTHGKHTAWPWVDGFNYFYVCADPGSFLLADVPFMRGSTVQQRESLFPKQPGGSQQSCFPCFPTALHPKKRLIAAPAHKEKTPRGSSSEGVGRYGNRLLLGPQFCLSARAPLRRPWLFRGVLGDTRQLQLNGLASQPAPSSELGPECAKHDVLSPARVGWLRVWRRAPQVGKWQAQATSAPGLGSLQADLERHRGEGRRAVPAETAWWWPQMGVSKVQTWNQGEVPGTWKDSAAQALGTPHCVHRVLGFPSSTAASFPVFPVLLSHLVCPLSLIPGFSLHPVMLFGQSSHIACFHQLA